MGASPTSRTSWTFDGLVSGRWGGWPSSLLRSGLRLAEFPYTWAVEVRNARYDRGHVRVERVGVPVISVGNITAGGTGKTPLVAWLARWLRDRGYRVGLISRGYKASGARPNDEALELRQALPDVPHIQQADRVAAARAAIDRFGCQVLVLDDAFQHRRIHRDLDIVLIDALQPFGYRHLLPRGLLREPLSGLARADVVGLSRADAVDVETCRALQAEIGRWAPHATWMELAHRPHQVVNVRGDTQPASSLAGRRVAAFCGIGNPAAFRRSLDRLGCDVTVFHAFPDHHAYGPADLGMLAAMLTGEPALEAVVCTCKDLVKLDVGQIGSVPLWALVIAIEVLHGTEALEASLVRVLDPPAQ